MILLDIIDPNSLPNLPLVVEQTAKDIVSIYLYVVAIATILIKIIPVLKDKNVLLPIIRAIAKYIALNRNSPSERPK